MLEAAHVEPFNGNNDTLDNSLLLRADLHKLFDRGLVTINPETNAVEFDSSVINHYGQYDGLMLNHKVSKHNLNKNYLAG